MLKLLKRNKIKTAINLHTLKMEIMDHEYHVMGMDELLHKSNCEARCVRRLEKLLVKYQ